MPSALPVVSRRRMLVATAALAALGITAVACGEPPPPPDLDDLMAQLDRARGDSQLASDVAATAKPPLRPVLAAISSDRSKHAEALTNEIARLTGAASTSSATTPSSAGAAPASAPTTKDVVAALRASADSAAQAAARMSGYRAGLLGSIAASCTASHTVALS